MATLNAHRLPTEGTPAAESGVMRRAAAVQSADMAPYMWLVHEEVGRMIRRMPANIERDDLVSAGAQGLLDALTRSPKERGQQFEWYARVRIRGAVQDELRSEDWLSRTARAEARSLASAHDDSAPASATNSTVIGFEDMPEHKRLVPVSESESPLDIAERYSQRMALGRAVGDLPSREAQIIEMHYFQGIQFKDIARALSVSEPRISQLHARAVGLLRDSLRDQWI